MDPATRAWDAAGRGTYVLCIGEHGLRTAIDRMRDRIGSFEASDNLFEWTVAVGDACLPCAKRRHMSQFRLGTKRPVLGGRVLVPFDIRYTCLHHAVTFMTVSCN